MDQYNKDLLAIREHPNQESLMADTALYNRLIDYNKRDMLPSAEIKAILERTPLPENSRSKVVSDSLRKESEKPIVETKPEPVKRSAGEAILQALFPRLMRRVEQGISAPGASDLEIAPGKMGGDIVAGALDAATFLPRYAVSEVQTGAEILGNLIRSGDFNEIKNAPERFIENVGVTETPTGTGALGFVEDVARGPLIPGGPVSTGGKAVVGRFASPVKWLASKPTTLGDITRLGIEAGTHASEAVPSALKTALGFVENLGTGAALGTSESVARGEGIDPTGVGTGAFFGALPYIGKGVGKLAERISENKSADNMLKAARDEYLTLLDKKRRAATELDKNNIQKQIDGILRNIKNLENTPRDVTQKFKTITENAAQREATARGLGEIQKFPTLKTAIDDYTSWKPGAVPPLLDPRKAQQLVNPTTATPQDLIDIAALGPKIGSLLAAKKALSGYTPEKIVNYVSRVLPDATSTMVYGTRAGNELITPLQTYFSQDSTKQ